MLKKFCVIIVAVIMLALILTACSGNPASESPPSVNPPSEPAVSVSSKTGVLIEVSVHVVSIQAPDGSTYTFGVNEETTVQGSELLGNTITVSYRGEYSSGIIAVSITTVAEVDHDSTPGKGSTDDPAAPQPKEPEPAHEKIWYMTGTVKGLTSNQLQLLYEDGHTYKVTIDNKTDIDKDVVVGCVARVFHKGRMVDGMVATEIHFIADKPADDSNTVWYLTGTVTDISEHQLLLLYEDGKTYTIIKDEHTRADPGIEIGTRVRVYHKGHLAEEMTATEVRLAPLLITQQG